MLVFISYNRLDRDFALHLRDHLQAWGYETWIDIENIPKGAHWPDEIDKALDAADVVVGVMSEYSMRSPNVKNEWDWALEYDKPLIPIRLRDCTISHRYVRINYIDFVENEAAGFAQLQTALVNPHTPYSEISGAIRVDERGTSRTPVKTVKEKRDPVDNRERLLYNVREFWIEGVLKPAKVGDAWLTLESDRLPDAVRPTRELHHPDFAAFTLGSGDAIAEMFDRLGKELLILGDPGSGKTMTLLELAQTLIARAEADPTLPVPVVLNLASWAEKQPPFDEWLRERLKLEYNVPHKHSQRWIENGKLTFLLDGLDEVRLEQCDACVAAINDFWRTYSAIDNGIVVCSRIADYEKLTGRLQLENAIVLNKLTASQADTYLAQLGANWANLRAALPQSAVLQTFAESPLLLNIMAVAYRDVPIEQITGFASETAQKDHLFRHYVDRCLAAGDHATYTHTKTRHYLQWLAGKLAAQGYIIFQIESLQPGWLETPQQVTRYRRGVAIIGGVIGGLIFGLPYAVDYGLIDALLVVVIVGLGVGAISWMVSGLDYIRIVDTLRWSWSLARPGLKAGLILGVIYTVVYGIAYAVFYGLDVDWISGLIGALISGLVYGVAFGLVSGLVVGLHGDTIELRTQPNQGIRRSLRNALITLAFFGLTFGLGRMFISGLGGRQDLNTIGSVGDLTWNWTNAGIGWVVGGGTGLVIGLVIGLMSSLPAVENVVFRFPGLKWLRFGDSGIPAILQHTSLRHVLYHANLAPLNYADFLDYCADRKLIRRVGGGYIFRHRMLMEYFAAHFTDH